MPPPPTPDGFGPAAVHFHAAWWENPDADVEQFAGGSGVPAARRGELVAYLRQLRAWLAGELARVLARFSEDWRRATGPATRPQIERVLPGECHPHDPPAKRVRLFARLLGIELSYRGKRGDLPHPDEYEGRFAGAEWADCRSRIADGYEQFDRQFSWRFRVVRARQADGSDGPSLALGKGGQAVVLLGFDEQLERFVAIKRVELSDTNVADHLLRREAKTLARLTDADLDASAGVPLPYGFGRDTKGRLCLALRLVRRADRSDPRLSARILAFHKAGGTPDRHDAAFLDLLAQLVAVCHTVGRAHAHPFRILHRDLKPNNILTDDAGRAFVIDWGLALWRNDAAVLAAVGPDVGGEMTAGTVGGGTDGYMSPEQARDEVYELDVPTDVFGLGASLFHLLTGRRVYDAAPRWWTLGRPVFKPLTDRDTLHTRAVDYIRAPHPRDVHPHADRELGDIVRKAVAPRPADRYPSADALADALTRWRADVPQATPSGAGWVRRRQYALARFLRKRWRLVLLLVGVLLLAAGGVWGAVAVWGRAG